MVLSVTWLGPDSCKAVLLLIFSLLLGWVLTVARRYFCCDSLCYLVGS